MAASTDRGARRSGLCLGKGRYFFSHHAVRFGSTTVGAFAGDSHAAKRHHALGLPGKRQRLQP